MSANISVHRHGLYVELSQAYTPLAKTTHTSSHYYYLQPWETMLTHLHAPLSPFILSADDRDEGHFSLTVWIAQGRRNELAHCSQVDAVDRVELVHLEPLRRFFLHPLI